MTEIINTYKSFDNPSVISKLLIGQVWEISGPGSSRCRSCGKTQERHRAPARSIRQDGVGTSHLLRRCSRVRPRKPTFGTDIITVDAFSSRCETGTESDHRHGNTFGFPGLKVRLAVNNRADRERPRGSVGGSVAV